jgi:hypothetical protein
MVKFSNDKELGFMTRKNTTGGYIMTSWVLILLMVFSFKGDWNRFYYRCVVRPSLRYKIAFDSQNQDKNSLELQKAYIGQVTS